LLSELLCPGALPDRPGLPPERPPALVLPPDQDEPEVPPRFADDPSADPPEEEALAEDADEPEDDPVCPDSVEPDVSEDLDVPEDPDGPEDLDERDEPDEGGAAPGEAVEPPRGLGSGEPVVRPWDGPPVGAAPGPGRVGAGARALGSSRDDQRLPVVGAGVPERVLGAAVV
jgi:hypothetical protein